MKRIAVLIVALLAAMPAAGVTKLLVTVIEKKSGAPVTDLQTGDFTVSADKVRRRVEACEFSRGVVDVMLLLDSSLLGGAVSPLAAELIKQLDEKEQMAIVAYHSAADLIQDFTSSEELLLRAVSEIEFGNSPRLLDALYAATDEGFEGASFRRVILLVTTGVDGPNRVSEKEVVRLARRNGVSIYPVYMMGYGRSLFERLARQTGGASFNLRDLSRRIEGSPAKRIFDVMRGNYTLTLSGNLPLGEDAKVEVKGKKKLLVSFLPLD